MRKALVSSNKKLSRGVSYGNNIKATAISLINDSNVPLNKVRKHIMGITDNEIMMSEGFLVKLQTKAVNLLNGFLNDLKNYYSLSH